MKIFPDSGNGHLGIQRNYIIINRVLNRLLSQGIKAILSIVFKGNQVLTNLKKCVAIQGKQGKLTGIANVPNFRLGFCRVTEAKEKQQGLEIQTFTNQAVESFGQKKSKSMPKTSHIILNFVS